METESHHSPAAAESSAEQLPLAFGPPDFCDRNQDAFWGCVEALETSRAEDRARKLKLLEATFPVEANLLRPRVRSLDKGEI